MQLNKLLQRQLQKHFGQQAELPENLIPLFNVISQSYYHYERDRNMLERSIDLSSKELIDLNLKLRNDLFERQKIEKELTHINQRLTHHLQNTPLAVVEWDGDLLVTNWNKKAEELFGWKKDEVMGRLISDLNLVFEEDVERVSEVSQSLVKGSIFQHMSENRNYTKTGGVLNCEWYNSVVKDDSGNVTAILSLVKDITERKQSEQELKNLNGNLTLLFENIDEALFSVNMVTYEMIQISPACQSIYGYEAEDFYNNQQLWYQAIHPDDKYVADQQLLALHKGERVTNQYRIIHKDSSVRWIENKVIPTLNHQGVLVRIDGLTSDITQKMLSERILKESNERYELATKATNDAIWDWNLTKNKLYWSEGYNKLFGYDNTSREQEVSIWTRRIYEEDKQRIEDSIRKIINDHTSDYWEDEYRYYRADGSVAFIRDRAFVVYDANRKPVRIVGAMQDITKQKKAELHLHKSESNLRNILENTDTAYVLLDENAKILSYNKAAILLAQQENMFEVEEGKLYTDLMPPARRDEVEQALAKVLKHGSKLNYEVKYDHEDKSFTWLHVSMHPIFSVTHQILGMSVAATNITARKKAETQLSTSEANLRTIFNNTNTAYLLLDNKCNIVSFNQTALVAYKKEYKFELEEGANLLECIPCERIDYSLSKFNRVLNGEKLNYELSTPASGNELNWYNVNMFPVYNGANMLGFIISSEDITERKNAQLERETITSDLIQRNRDLQQFAYIVSHNLRSPVANIIGLSNLITQPSHVKRDDLNRMVGGLRLSTQKLDEVIQDLNYILQIRGQIVEKREMVNLSHLVQDIKTSISTLLEKENMVIDTDFKELDSLFTLKSYMNSIFYNLITNSIKYRSASKAPRINIQTTLANQKVYIHFSDNGIGIDLIKNENRVFGLYKKFHPHIEGKGMGLYMVKTQVESLGGKISVDSEVDRGTRFTIEFDA